MSKMLFLVRFAGRNLYRATPSFIA